MKYDNGGYLFPHIHRKSGAESLSNDKNLFNSLSQTAVSWGIG